LDAIWRVEWDAFLNHPQHEPGAPPHEPALVNALRDANALTLSLVAEEDGEIVGHIAFSEILIDDRNVGWHGAGPLAVVPRRQRNGIGKALMNQGLSELKAMGSRGVALVGDPEYYKRFSFASNPDLRLPGVPQEYVLTLSFETPAPSGDLKFHPAFCG
jgi:putative acetyltransferase